MSGLLVLIAIAAASLTGCAARDESVQGILQKVDQSRGVLVVETRDGQTKEYTLDSSSRANSGNKPFDIAWLEPGLSVQVNTRGKVAATIDVTLTQVSGTIDQSGKSEFTIKPTGTNQTVKLQLKAFSVVHTGETRVLPESVAAGSEGRALYNPVSKTAFELELTTAPPQAKVATPNLPKIEGVAVGYRLEVLTLMGNGGKTFGVRIDENTKIYLPDKSPGTVKDVIEVANTLRKDAWIEAYFSPVTKTAVTVMIVKIEH